MRQTPPEISDEQFYQIVILTYARSFTSQPIEFVLNDLDELCTCARMRRQILLELHCTTLQHSAICTILQFSYIIVSDDYYKTQNKPVDERAEPRQAKP